MIRLTILFILTCVVLSSTAQVNFVLNPDLEKYSDCPTDWNQIYRATNWGNATDTVFHSGLEYYNSCGNSGIDVGMHIPDNSAFYQYPHSGNGVAGAHFYFDKLGLGGPDPLPFHYRDYLQGRLIKKLVAGKSYCVTLFVYHAEASGFGMNKIGAYLDNGTINKIPDTAGQEITTVLPQIFTDSIIKDTTTWFKIEGNFIASGDEDHITIGNFFPNSAISTVVTDFRHALKHYTYYLIDDISVVESGHKADAGPDSWIPLGSKKKIGPTDPTAVALDCKWYNKGTLIDSGATITVNSASLAGSVDTYVVVQTLCGVITRDTMLLSTVPVGINDPGIESSLSIYPNPSQGSFTIGNPSINTQITAIKIYDPFGRIVWEQNTASIPLTIDLNSPPGVYIVEVSDIVGNTYRKRICKR